MSDVSVLSHEYQTASELSQVLNRSLIALKKALLGCQGAATAELEADRLRLAQIADALVLLLSPAPSHAMSETTARVPGSLVARLRVERGGDLDYFLGDLRQTSDRLRNRPEDLTDNDIAVLEQVAASADAETTKVFRRLMRT